ncbi:MAG: integrase [Candidatus Methanomethyliaceae archaeon]
MGSNPTPRTRNFLVKSCIKNNINQPSASKPVGSRYCKFAYSKSIDFTVIQDFKEFCAVERQLSIGTVRHYVSAVTRLLAFAKKDYKSINVRDIRQYLILYKNSWSYANQLKALKLFFGVYLGKDIMNGFVFPPKEFSLDHYLPKKEDLRKFFESLEDLEDKALFLFFASSGLRRDEVINLQVGDIDLNARICIVKHYSRTKKAIYGFFNEESKQYLEEWLKQKSVRSLRVFPMPSYKKYLPFKYTRLKTGLPITPKVLRFWFANEMARLGVPDRFIDAFQGRIPRSVLARHYTDYSLENMKAIYDKAGLKVLS